MEERGSALDIWLHSGLHASILNIFALNYVGLRTNIITVVRCTGSLRAVCDGCWSQIRVNQTFRFGYQSLIFLYKMSKKELKESNIGFWLHFSSARQDACSGTVCGYDWYTTFASWLGMEHNGLLLSLCVTRHATCSVCLLLISAVTTLQIPKVIMHIDPPIQLDVHQMWMFVHFGLIVYLG